jgi:PAS domain S-box-containing protein/diguanylate cyclase (GGDEF)-like protein
MTNIIKRILFSTNTLEQKHDDSILLLEQYKSTVDRSFIVSKTDPNGIITYVNDEFCNTCGYERDEIIGKSHNVVRHKDMPKELFKEIWHTIKELKQPWFGEIKNLNKDGTPYWVKVIINPITNNQGNIIEYIGIKTDITKMKNALITDFLTGCENRFKLNSDICESENLSIAIFNIDNFRQFNDFYGHSFGDKIIMSIANIMSNIISEHKNLKFYRLQSDEFAVLAQNEKKDTFIDIIYKILTHIKSNNITVDQEIVFIRCSCGISFESKENLFSTADMALKVAKKRNDDYIIFDESISLNEEYEKNIKCTRKLSNAIKEGCIITYYQPIVNNSNLSYEKYECLVRMIDGNRVVTPYFFLEVAKQTRQYLDITKTVIYQSFEMFKDKEA